MRGGDLRVGDALYGNRLPAAADISTNYKQFKRKRISTGSLTFTLIFLLQAQTRLEQTVPTTRRQGAS